MRRQIQSIASRTLFLALLAPLLVACYATEHVALGPSVKPSEITGVTTVAGWQMSFKKNGATIANDTLRAIGPNGAVRLPKDSIRSVTVHRFDTTRTVGMTAGVAGIAILVGAVVQQARWMVAGGHIGVW
jgi:hypothetical protein